MEAVEGAQITRVFEPRRRTATRVVALEYVSLSVPVGEIHGLLGPNGAVYAASAETFSRRYAR